MEKDLEKLLVRKVKDSEGLALKFHCISFTGFPDRMVLMPGGRFYLVEMKAEGRKVLSGSRQEFVHRQLRDLGFIVWVVSSREAVEDFIALIGLGL